ncbi:hypothetical protein Q8A73_023317 [Channa argus]|nr:hypothetical protein Q8A73_023317 [Channa argus]
MRKQMHILDKKELKERNRIQIRVVPSGHKDKGADIAFIFPRRFIPVTTAPPRNRVTSVSRLQSRNQGKDSGLLDEDKESLTVTSQRHSNGPRILSPVANEPIQSPSMHSSQVDQMAIKLRF